MPRANGFVLGFTMNGRMPMSRESNPMLETSLCAASLIVLLALTPAMPAQTNAPSTCDEPLDAATLDELKSLYKQLIDDDPDLDQDTGGMANGDRHCAAGPPSATQKQIVSNASRPETCASDVSAP